MKNEFPTTGTAAPSPTDTEYSAPNTSGETTPAIEATPLYAPWN
jgi:hypothetical protein